MQGVHPGTLFVKQLNVERKIKDKGGKIRKLYDKYEQGRKKSINAFKFPNHPGID